MFGPTTAAGFGGPPLDFRPITNQPDLDEWLWNHLDTSQLEAIRSYDPQSILRSATVVRLRHEKQLVQLPGQYLLKVMMSNARNTPYSGRPTASPSARPSSPTSQHSQGCKVEHQPITRPMASPQHARLPQSQPTREVPKWVRSAWTLHDKRSELMRSLSRSLPYDAMDALAPLSSVLQYTACIMLLVSPEAHSDPPTFFKNFVSMVQPLIAPPPVLVPGQPLPSSLGQPVALVHLGLSSGFEWMGALLAQSGLESWGVRMDVRDRIACVLAGACPDKVLEHIMANHASDTRSPTAVHYTSIGDLHRVLMDHTQKWILENTAVFVVVSLPMTQGPLQSAGGFGSEPSTLPVDFWKYLTSLKLMGSRLDRLSVVIISPARDPDDSNSILTQMFGSPVLFKSAGFRLPQHDWHVRFSPEAVGEPRYVPRVPDFVGSQVCHADLHTAWGRPGDVYTAVLPPLMVLEDYADAVVDNTNLLQETVDAIRLAMHVNGDREPTLSRKLLTRAELAGVFGIVNVPWAGFWNNVMPCQKIINHHTGTLGVSGAPECVECGFDRYCGPCGQFYECLVETTSLPVLQEVWHMCLERRLRMDRDSRLPTADFSRVPDTPGA